MTVDRSTSSPRSREVTDGHERAPARAMLRAIGMTDDDWDKPQVGVASSWNEVTPCNLPLDRLAKRSKEGVRAAGGFPIEFTTIAVSATASRWATRACAPRSCSREIIADSVETVMHAERLRRAGHLRRVRQVAARACSWPRPASTCPSVFLYGGSILPGPPQRPGARHRQRVRGGRRPRRGHDRRRRAAAHRAQRLPDRGQLRRHVHRQHDGVGRRGASACRCPARSSPPGRRPPARRLRLRVGPGRSCACSSSASGRARS